MPETCLTLICPRGLEENVLDLLLAMAGTAVIESMPCHVHGLDPRRLDAAEQVLGGARATRIEVIVAESDKAAILGALRKRFRQAGLRYWAVPVEGSGGIA